MTADALELWGGIECTVNRVGDRWFDQMAWSGHDARIDDLDRFAALGLRTIRYPILWERLAPHTLEDIDWRWSDERVARLRDLGITPIAGLVHHGSGPHYTSLLDPTFPELLARVAGAVARRYPWITNYTPVNEPLTTARFSALYGHWYPHRRNDRDYVRALLNQLRAVVLAMRAIREVTPGAQLIQTEDCGRSTGTDAMRSQVAHECGRRLLTWDLLTGRVDRDHLMRDFLVHGGMTEEDEAFFLESQERPAVLGLNYYVTSDRYLDDRSHRYPIETHASNGFDAYADLEAVRANPDGIVGHEAHLMDAWDRYRIPVAITEVHLGCTRDEQIRWLVEAWTAAQRARARGADVRAVTTWALLGSFNWDSLVTRDRGSYEPGAFDVRGPTPRKTALGSLVEALAAARTPRHPALVGDPWWRRPERMIHSAGTVHSATNGAPLLVIGSTGTLGRAFQRMCHGRGLAARIVSRRDVDITDARQVDAILRRIEPWALVNAAGYVRVDDAERDREACHRANVLGPVHLAAACRRHGIPLVTFSSDLVFDGREGRPYVEDDEPRPLSVYGSAKAEAERRVMTILPDALVVRTSAFFGPWDEHNFLAALFHALDSDVAFHAPRDAVVSPTYVPDLVDAVLDLLVDGERGLWHVANHGAVTWLEFARAAAEVSGRALDGIVATDVASAWGPAARPSYSALSSRRARLLRPLPDAIDAYVRATAGISMATGTDRCASQ